MHNNYFKLRIKAIKEETSDTKSFILDNIGSKALNYEAGQFLTLIFQHSNREEVRRNYSISSSAVMNEPLTITVKKIPNGEFSRLLVDHAQVGDLLYSIGASGLFKLPKTVKSDKQRFCFFAAGSRITPIYAQIKTLLFGSQQKVLLVYSNRNPPSSIFLKDLLLLKDNFKERFVLELLFSESASIMESRLTQYVLDHFAERHLLYQRNTFFYLCGPEAYMRMIYIKLRAEGVTADNIKRELFVVHIPSYKLPEPPDKEEHEVRIYFNTQQFSLPVQYPTSILAAAKKQQIPLPYSCENGQCGTCAAICTKGKVWMRYNEVLGEKAVNEGYILTCTGYPIEGPVEIRI